MAHRTLLLVDGSNLLMRAYFATKHTKLSANGEPTAALNTFISMLSKYVRQEKPDYLMVCWDGGKSEHRTAIFPGYKAARIERSEEDRTHFHQAKEFCRVAGIQQREVLGVEADDLIAHYTLSYDMFDVVILSGDHDFLQLLGGKVTQIRPGTSLEERWTPSRVRQEYGVSPHNFAKVLALAGDSGDNVPGIPRFGIKTAAKALKKHDWSLERTLSEDPRLFGYREDVLRNRALVDLRRHAPIEFDPVAQFDPVGPATEGWDALVEFLDRYELARVRESLQAGSLWQDRTRVAVRESSDGSPSFRRGGLLDPPLTGD